MKKSKPETRGVKRPHVDENEAQAALAKRGQSMPKMSISLSRATKLGTTARNTLNLQNKPLERKPEILKKVNKMPNKK